MVTIAGNGANAYSGDGVPAVSAPLVYPWTVTAYQGGYLFSSGYSIQQLWPNGTLTYVVSKSHTYGNSGDGGLAVNAQIRGSSSIRADPAGSGGGFLISDDGSNGVRRVGDNGTIWLVAGSYVNGFTGDGGPATSAKIDQRGIGPDGVVSGHVVLSCIEGKSDCFVASPLLHPHCRAAFTS